MNPIDERENKFEVFKLIRLILSQTTYESINDEKVSKLLNLEPKECRKILKQLEKMNLVSCYFQPTDFARQLMRIETDEP